MVEELKLAIKIDDATVEQSLLKQFANAQKMADKVVLDFKNVNFDDKQIEAKFKEMQKKAGQNPIDLSISGNTLDMLGQIDKRLTEIFSIGKGKSFIDSSSTVADIGKIENKINELNKKYEEAQKKLSSIGSDNISGKNVNLVDNEEFKKLSQEVSELKNQFDDLKTHMQLLDDYTVPTDRFFELQSQVETTTVKVSDLVEEFAKLSNAQKALSSTPQESNISSEVSNSAIEQQIKSESELNAEIEKRENIIRELQQLQEKLTVHEDFHGNDRYFADQLPTEEEVREADKRIKQLTGTNNIFDVDKLIQDRNEWLSEVKYSLEEYDDLIKTNDQKALDEYTTRGLSRIDGAESFFGYEDNNFSIASKFIEEKEKIQNEINDLYIDLDKLDKKMNLDSNNSSVDNTVQAQEKLQSELKETQEQAEKTAQAVKEVASATTSTEQKKDAFPDKDISASVESATNSIKEENNVLEQNTQKVKENTQAKGQNANVNLNKYDKRLDSYNGKVDKYQATIARFNDGGWTSDTYLKNVQAVKNAVNEYETLLKELKGKDASLVTSEDINKLDDYEKKIKDTIATVTNMSASEKGYNFVSAQKELDKIHKLLNENSNMSAEAKAKIKSYYAEIESGNPSMSLDRIHGEIMKIYNAEVEAGRAGKSFFDTLKNSGFHQIAAQMAGMFGVYDVINVVRQGVNTVRELDEAMTEVRKVSNATETQYTSFRDTISSTAKEIATTNKELLNSSADFLRLGYSLDQASDLAKNATLFVNVGDGVDITEATEDMITAMKAFDIQAKDSIKIVDDYNQIGNQFALSASDIGEAMKRSASALETGNNSFEQSIGLITAMNEIVQNSENTGNSLKVLSLRLRGAKAELEDMQEDTDGLCDSTSKLREQIMSLTGVDIMLDDNTFKSTTDIIKELGAVWDKLSDSSQAATLELIAGKSRANNIAALLKNYQRIDEVMESLGDAEGSAMRENEAIVDSINGRIKVLSATAEEFWKSFIDTDLVKNTVSLLSDMLNILTQIIDKGGALATLGIGGTGVGIGAFIKNFSWLTKSYKTRQSFLVG